MNLDNVKKLPDSSGVYMMLNDEGVVIYIGKAKSLRKRVGSYFSKKSGHSPRIEKMIFHIADIDFIVTENEVEALILESNLIKKHTPQYNVILRDDKHYPYIKITTGEDFPRIMVVRGVKRDKNLYLGPYPSSSALKEVLRFIYRTFRIRQCKGVIREGEGRRPCLNYQMGICLAPCSGNVGEEEYNSLLNEAILFLKGKNKRLIADLKKEMKKASGEELFEKAAFLRDQMVSIEKVLEKQSINSTLVGDLDVVALARGDDMVAINLLIVRGGEVVGNNPIIVKEANDVSEGEIMYAFLTQHYSKEHLIPPNIILGTLPEDQEGVEAWLGGLSGRRVSLLIPQRGIKKELLNRSLGNALVALKMELEGGKIRGNALEELRDILGMESIPERIEAFDISTIVGGKESVASMTVLTAGEKDKAEYRHFRLRTIEGVDDYGMMREVLRRRFHNRKKKIPDLIVIDGGVGQLRAAEGVVRKTFSLDIPIVSIAKGEDRNNPNTDIVYTSGGVIVDFFPDAPAKRLLQLVRDEAHRFAIDYHRKLREKGASVSQLDMISGIGKARKEKLLKAFGSVEGIKMAKGEDIAKGLGVGEKTAERILLALNNDN